LDSSSIILDGTGSGKRLKGRLGRSANRTSPVIWNIGKGRAFFDFSLSFSFIRVLNKSAVWSLALIHFFWLCHWSPFWV
jgi:hypothetical protein